MSVDLADLKRLKITKRTRAWLQAAAHSSGRSQQEIARDALDELAAKYIHAATVLVALATDEAHAGATQAHSRDSGGRRK